MGHLNELQDEYSAKGLTVISITNEGRGKVDGFVDQYGLTHPLVIESSNSLALYGGSGYPTSVLIGPDGNVAWKGHPASLKSEQIEELLKNVRLFPELPKALKSVSKNLEKDKYAAAVKGLEKFIADENKPEEDRTAATEALSWINENAQSTLDGAKANIERGNHYEAASALEDLAETHKGLPVADEAAAALKHHMADKDFKREVTAGQKFADAKKKANDLSKKKAIKLMQTIAKKYKGTKAGEKARVLAIRLASAQ